MATKKKTNNNRSIKKSKKVLDKSKAKVYVWMKVKSLLKEGERPADIARILKKKDGKPMTRQAIDSYMRRHNLKRKIRQK